MAGTRQREKTLMIVTAVIVVLGLGFSFMPEDLEFSLPMFGARIETAGSLGEARKTFRTYRGWIQRGERIEADFRRIRFASPPESPGRRPQDEFARELYDLLTRTLNVPTPDIGTAAFTRIPDVDEYYFVELEVSVEGSYDQLTDLLTQIDRRGLLIREFIMQQSRRGTDDRLSLDFVVARLVKHDEDSRRYLKKWF